jgi:UDP-N-acetylglucosamine--N-acetylmuramyl-(pentapeptide) pyrophosphoryl-undecaprenol N-acetylglucosamine transferase
MKRILLAGGGTAGHIEPALSVARAWKSLHQDSEITFLGTEEGLETRLVPAAGFDLQCITKVRIARKISPSLLLVPFTLAQSIFQCISLMRRTDLLVGFGGYVSAPAYLAAAITRTPFVIHEANARPGIANRLGAHFTKYSAVAHGLTQGRLTQSIILGLPLKENIAKAFERSKSDWQKARREAKKSLGFNPSEPLIFVFGGSQGSQAINSAIFQSANQILNKGVQIYHGVGAKNQLPESRNGYQAVHYISDMATAYLAADLIISRSGAVTCSEVNTLGRYALFIPLPIGNGEQELNAADLISQSRAEIISQREFTSEWICAHIARLLEASAAAPISGSEADISAAPKMVSLMEHALRGGK